MPLDWNLVWLVLLVLFVIVEALTVNLITIWFALGALAALLCSALGLGFGWQIGLFLAVSLGTLLLTRPLVKRMQKRVAVKTNFDRIVGMSCVVTEAIDNLTQRGCVYVDGKEWSARSEDGTEIAVGTEVRIGKIEGNKVFVKPV